MSLAYETSEETVSPFRYMVPSVGLEPTTIGLKDHYANHCVTMAWWTRKQLKLHSSSYELAALTVMLRVQMAALLGTAPSLSHPKCDVLLIN